MCLFARDMLLLTLESNKYLCALADPFHLAQKSFFKKNIDNVECVLYSLFSSCRWSLKTE